MSEQPDGTNVSEVEAPHPGSKSMPQWNVGELIDAPQFRWKNWTMLLGPGLLMGGAAIGGGEWLIGPIVTAKYGGSLLWLATLSILGQVLYNIEISRYTLYTGEPIFTGKFRTLPGPMFWVFMYLVLDFGSVFPYLAANAATPLGTVILGHVPNPEVDDEKFLLRVLAYCIFFAAFIPLIFGGKIYNALKAIMSFKIVTVMGFLLVLAVFYSHGNTWTEIFSGFFQFGNVPIRRAEDANRNGVLDPGEDWDGDGRLDVVEPSLKLKFGTMFSPSYATDIDADGIPDNMVNLGTEEEPKFWPDLDADGVADKKIHFDTDGDGTLEGPFEVDANNDGELDSFIDINKDGLRDGDNVENIFVALWQGRPFPKIDWTMVAFLSALVAISGSGGLGNTPISNYTRDQGWGMGHLVGAIPSVVGRQDIQLSHVGTVFIPDAESLPRWKRWYRHVMRDQLCVWMPACFFGLALPSMLSVEFLPRGTEAENNWVAASMTADAVSNAVGGRLGAFFWFMTLFCGFLVLAPSMASSADGVVRRWVDVFWTSSARLRRLDPKAIRYVYFGVLVVFGAFGATMLALEAPTTLLLISATIFNFALGISAWHTLWLNVVLLPRELRPCWAIRIMLFLTGLFFLSVGTVSAMQKMGKL